VEALGVGCGRAGSGALSQLGADEQLHPHVLTGADAAF
jgi:hypothetical protein